MRGFKTNTIKQSRREAELERYAWRNRRAMTESEAALWDELRGGKLSVTFRRQVPLCGRYIADFFAPAARLVVEVDGSYHARRRSADRRRDRVLASHGYRTLRIAAQLVLGDRATARALIVRALGLAGEPEVARTERRAAWCP